MGNKKTKRGLLSDLYYDLGRQQTNFRVTSTYEQDGETRFTKWIPYLTAQEDDYLINKVNQREQLKNEIILDLDLGGQKEYLELIEKLKGDGIKFYAYATEEWRARQIHTFWNGLSLLGKRDREEARLFIIKKYGCDLMLKSDGHVIPLEFFEHWKTGKVKNLVDCCEGDNDLQPTLDTIEELKPKKKEDQSFFLIDNFQKNAEEFYSIQPYFHDESGLFWLWNMKENKYERKDDVDIMRLFDSLLNFRGQTINSSIRNNYLEAFKRCGREHKPKPAPIKWIQFKDKAISLESEKTYKITHDYFFTNPIPWEIGESEDTPIIDKLIIEWVGEEYKQTAYEIIAYCCYSDYPIHLIFCLVGSGRNGKSKFLGLINNFIGQDNICSTELDILIHSRFESFKLYKKLICSMGETNFGVISKTSLLKKLTGQDLIGYEFKNKLPFDSYNYAKILISSNSLPPSEDTSEGFYRRWLILDFPNTFPEGQDILKTIPDVEYTNLAKKVAKILPKLLLKGNFNKQGTIEDRTQRYIAASNPLSQFIDEYCYKAMDNFMRYSELYTHYQKYLHKNKKRKIGYREFSDVLAIEGLEIVKTTKSIDGNFVNGRFIEGICLKETGKEVIEIKEEVIEETKEKGQL